ncbi:MAG: hypothetical protein IH830_03855 [Planctomycetes bacterium]|nr:hypothetical protein [Planctomycetota bacterium]
MIVIEAAALEEAYPDWVKMICAGALTNNEHVGYRNLEMYRAQLCEQVRTEMPDVARRLRYISRATLIPLSEWRAGDGLLQRMLDELALVVNEAQIDPAPTDGAGELEGFKRPVKLRRDEVEGIIGKRSYSIARSLRTAGCKVVVVNHAAYAEHDDLCQMFPKYRKYHDKSGE